MRLFLSILISIILLNINCDQLWANPIVKYKQGENGRAETVRAIIRMKDLRTGQSTSQNKRLAAQIRAMGKEGDSCGHIVANVLGGPMQPYNLFPQNAKVNSGEFRETVESHMQRFLEMDEESDHIVDYQAQLLYKSDEDTRPIMLKFKIRFLKGSTLVPFSEIPRAKKHHVPSNPYVGVVQNP